MRDETLTGALVGSILRLALACFLLAPLAAAAQPEPGWEAARKAIIADYAKQQPGDKVQEVTGPEKREAIIIAVRYYGSVLVQRADGSRTRDRVLVEYRLVGSRWELERVHAYESQALADLKPPSAQEAQKILLAAWQGAKCEAFDGLAVAIDGEPRYQLETTADRANAKRWFVYSVKVSARGNGKFRLSEDGAAYVNATQNMLLWNPAQKSWTVEARHLRCTGFSKSK
jgi:hypothetical protein